MDLIKNKLQEALRKLSGLLAAHAELEADRDAAERFCTKHRR